MLGLSLRDQIRNEEIRRKTMINDIAQRLRGWGGSGQGILLVEQIAAGAEKFSSGDRLTEDAE